MRNAALFAIAATVAGPVLAEAHMAGDPAAGEKAFRQCVSCHVVQDDAGETLAGKNGRTGPNLYAIALRPYGARDDFSYSSSMVAAGEAGNVWTEPSFAAYVQDPTGHLREVLDDSGARGKMSFRLRKEEDAVNVWAYLVSLGPDLTDAQMEELSAASGR